MEHQARAISNMDISATPINGSEAANEKRPQKIYLHIPLELDPHLPFNQRRTIPQCPRTGIYRVITWIGDRVVSHTPSHIVGHLPWKPDWAHRQTGPVPCPISIPSPASINYVHSRSRPRYGDIYHEEEEEERWGQFYVDVNMSSTSCWGHVF